MMRKRGGGRDTFRPLMPPPKTPAQNDTASSRLSTHARQALSRPTQRAEIAAEHRIGRSHQDRSNPPRTFLSSSPMTHHPPQPTTHDEPNLLHAHHPGRPTNPPISMAAPCNPPQDQHHARLLPPQPSPSRLTTTHAACPADLTPAAPHAHRRPCPRRRYCARRKNQ